MIQFCIIYQFRDICKYNIDFTALVICLSFLFTRQKISTTFEAQAIRINKQIVLCPAYLFKCRFNNNFAQAPSGTITWSRFFFTMSLMHGMPVRLVNGGEGLEAESSYSYRVGARDKSPNQNLTHWSSVPTDCNLKDFACRRLAGKNRPVRIYNTAGDHTSHLSHFASILSHTA